MSKKLVSPQAFLERTRPMLGLMYQTALLITDHAEAAETALQQALLETYLSDTDPHDRRALRERLRRETRACAIEHRRRLAPADREAGEWRGVAGVSLAEDAVLSRLLSHFSLQDLQAQRLLLLRYGCGFSLPRAAETAGMTGERAAGAIASFRAESAAVGHEAWDRACARMCRRLLEEPGTQPDMSAVCRAFERDAVGAIRGKRKRRNVPGIVLCVLGVAVCALLFWLIAILLEPSHAPQAAEEAVGMARTIRI